MIGRMMGRMMLIASLTSSRALVVARQPVRPAT
jgi:hypothetical protein